MMSATVPFDPTSVPASPARAYPARPDQIPAWLSHRAPLRARFARTQRDLEAIQRLRYRVFNLELGEGLASARTTGRDADAYDANSHHLMVFDERARIVVGTYRLATHAMAERGAGFYAEREFDLSALDPGALADSVELGRACIAAPYRGRRVLAMLWQGIAAYALHNRARFLFGCTSLPAQLAPAAAQITRMLGAAGSVDPALAVRPRSGFEPPASTGAPSVGAEDVPPRCAATSISARVAAQRLSIASSARSTTSRRSTSRGSGRAAAPAGCAPTEPGARAPTLR
jgi:putative hemolysin